MVILHWHFVGPSFKANMSIARGMRYLACSCVAGRRPAQLLIDLLKNNQGLVIYCHLIHSIKIWGFQLNVRETDWIFFSYLHVVWLTMYIWYRWAFLKHILSKISGKLWALPKDSLNWNTNSSIKEFFNRMILLKHTYDMNDYKGLAFLERKFCQNHLGHQNRFKVHISGCK